jgi:DNA repair protein RadC
MGGHALLAILLAEEGCELARIALSTPKSRDELPLRDMAAEGLRHDATAMIVVRAANDEACLPCADEMRMIDKARRTLGAIGLRLHDYILWHGEHSVSLRLTGRL